jgi:2-phospho-L-lactate guanylyltransferase
MQGTVAEYDSEQRSGTVLLDDGTRLAFEASALDGTGLRLLRPGQRVRVDGTREHVDRVQILTLP